MLFGEFQRTAPSHPSLSQLTGLILCDGQIIFRGENDDKKRSQTKLVREGKYVAEVDIELIETDGGWSLYLSLEDAYKLDAVRDALRRGDIKNVLGARVFTLTPVAM